MSLINDMLRDLEARRATEQRVPAGLLHATGHAAPARSPRRLLLIALTLTLLLLAAAVAWLAWQRYSTPAPAVAVAPTIAPVPALPPTSTPAPDPVADGSAPAVTETPAPAAVEPPPMAAPAPDVAPVASVAVTTPPPEAAPPVVIRPAAEPVPRPAARPASAPVAVEKTVRPPTPQLQAETEYQRGVNALRGGNQAAAETALRTALRLDGEHLLARETLAAVLLGAGRLIEADEVLEQGRRQFARNPTLALLLARLRVEQGQTGAAVTILEQTLHAATARADYLAFLAALYQRELRYEESIESYGRALALQPQQASWWVGMGISLENAGRRADAVKAYEQAAAGALPPQLQDHVRNRLKALE